MRRLIARARPIVERVAVPAFVWAYYSRKTWLQNKWLGVPTFKLPSDLWVYQEIMHELRPDLIVETGTAHGGSALFLANVCDLVGNGRLITIDIEAADRPTHDRIEYVTASSIDSEVVERVHQAATGTVLVILDSDHSRDHVLAELRAYAPIVTPGSYVIVEDTNVNGHPVARSHGPGPMDAVNAFIADTTEFSVDRSRERFLHTFNPRGYLRRHGAAESP